jgi:2Fe-2S ferredoxin
MRALIAPIEPREDARMTKVTFVEFNGTEHVVDAENGLSLMKAAVNNLVPGIDADCGGECSCATCHVMVDEAWIGKVGKPQGQEATMLDMAPERAETSRLSCQIKVTPELDGIVVRLPQFQM